MKTFKHVLYTFLPTTLSLLIFSGFFLHSFHVLPPLTSELKLLNTQNVCCTQCPQENECLSDSKSHQIDILNVPFQHDIDFKPYSSRSDIKTTFEVPERSLLTLFAFKTPFYLSEIQRE